MENSLAKTSSKESRVMLWILLCFPLIYVLNSFMPWSTGLWVEKSHGSYMPFWCSIIILHIISFGVAMFVLRKSGYKLGDIGINIGAKGIVILLASLVVIGVVILLFTEHILSTNTVDIELMKVQAYSTAQTTGERIFWIFTCLAAGFFEEFYYRGCIQGILLKRWKNWLPALLISTLTFCIMHSFAVFSNAVFYLVAGLIFGSLYLLTKRLWINIALHALFDITAMMGVLSFIQ